MKNAALAKALEAAQPIDLDPSALPRIAPTQQPTRVVISPPPRAAPRGLLHALWLRLFGPPAIDPRYDTRDFGAFRAFAEVGSDYLPSSGTWPPPTSDRS